MGAADCDENPRLNVAIKPRYGITSGGELAGWLIDWLLRELQWKAEPLKWYVIYLFYLKRLSPFLREFTKLETNNDFKIIIFFTLLLNIVPGKRYLSYPVS